MAVGGHGRGANKTRNIPLSVVSAIMFVLLSATSSCLAELTKLEHPAKPDGSLSVLVVGDWGRKGLYNQSRIAEQMGIVGSDKHVDFVISTGDNFYEDGLTGVDDPAFDQSFTSIYTADSLNTQWYSVLGNHDYRGDVLAQLSPALREVDTRWLCMRSFVVGTDAADFFFVDTTPFQLKYWKSPEKDEHNYDWRDVAPRGQYVENLLKDLDYALRESTAPWKIVVGHHTAMRSVSDHGDTQELLDLLLPVLQANGVDLYINGHDHCIQHISSRDSPIQYLTSGGGSKAWRGVFKSNADDLRFFYDGQGFMTLEISRDGEYLQFVFYDIHGKALHQSRITKDRIRPVA